MFKRGFPLVLALCLWLTGNLLVGRAAGQSGGGNGKTCDIYYKTTDNNDCSITPPCNGNCKHYVAVLGRCVAGAPTDSCTASSKTVTVTWKKAPCETRDTVCGCGDFVGQDDFTNTYSTCL